MDVNSSISLLSHIHSITADFLTAKLKERGFPDFASSHGNILFQLSVNEKMPMGDLAKKINRDKSTTTVLVRKLEVSGLVELKKDEKDGRKKIMTLTREGTKYTKAMEEISRQLLVTSWKDFKPEEQTQLLSYLTKLSENLK